MFEITMSKHNYFIYKIFQQWKFYIVRYILNFSHLTDGVNYYIESEEKKNIVIMNKTT
jgi:hypothetical protein